MSHSLALPSDITHPSISIITVPSPFTGSPLDKSKGNFKAWRNAIYPALALIGLWTYTKPNAKATAPSPLTEPRAFANWKENDRRSCAYIFSALSEAEFLMIDTLEEDAAEFWKRIERRHTNQIQSQSQSQAKAKAEVALTGPRLLAQVHLIQSAMDTCLSNDIPFQFVLGEISCKLDDAWAMGPVTLDSLKCIFVLHAAHSYKERQKSLLDFMINAPKSNPVTLIDMYKYISGDYE
ncbi:hypothetical protein D9613_004279 [Agrocybe pediades]|uniref:Uncharacterized protein n=1 Tax=Agrocybe pediades TaxID=84607 RepID=A0A8H4QJF5_9AGAR|nr:hypothetical protein D9613_004279 [Agrocybe pediades]